MYTFITLDTEGKIVFDADLALVDVEHIANRLAFWDTIVPTEEENCIALIVDG